MIKRLLMALVLLPALAQTATAEVVFYDGVYYSISSPGATAVVTNKPGEPDFHYSGVVRIASEVPYGGQMSKVYGGLASQIFGDAVTELHYADGFESLAVYQKELNGLEALYLPKSVFFNPDGSAEEINDAVHNAFFEVVRTTRAIDCYAEVHDGDMYIRVKRFNVYDSDGNKLKYLAIDHNGQRLYPDGNGLIGPIATTTHNDSYWRRFGTNPYTHLRTERYFNITLVAESDDDRFFLITNTTPNGITGNSFISGGYRYDINADGKGVSLAREVVDCQYSGDITIPEKVSDGTATYPVENIGAWAFLNNRDIASVTLPPSVKAIGDLHHESYELPFDVTFAHSFFNCTGLHTVNFSEGLVALGGQAFEGCSALKSIELPNSLSLIGLGAFANCTALEKVVLGSGVRIIAMSAFYNCPALRGVFCMSACPPRMSSNSFGTDTYRDATLYVPIGSAEVYSKAFGWSQFKHIEEIAESDIDNVDLHKQDYIFYVDDICYNVDDIAGTATITGVSDNFVSTNLLVGKTVTSPVNGKVYPITEISDKAFFGCTTLKAIDTRLVTTIGDNAFYGCTNLETARLPHVIHAGAALFYSCSKLKTLSIFVLSELCNYAFHGCERLKTIDARVAAALGASVFNYCGVETLRMPYLEYLNSPLNAVELRELEMPRLLYINSGAFRNCGNLEEVKLPWLEEFSSNIFDSSACPGIKKVWLCNAYKFNCPEWNKEGFQINVTRTEPLPEDIYDYYCADQFFNNVTIAVPAGSKETYARHAFWGRFANIVEIDMDKELAEFAALYKNNPFFEIDGITYEIEDDHTASVRRLADRDTSVIPASIYYLGEEYPVKRIYNLGGTTKHLVANHIETVVEYCRISGLSELETLEMNSLKQVPEMFAWGINSLKEVSMTSAVSVGSLAFRNCTNLEKVQLPAAETIDSGAFGYTGLEELELPNAMNINRYAFENTPYLTKLAFNKAVQFDGMLHSVEDKNSNMSELHVLTPWVPVALRLFSDDELYDRVKLYVYDYAAASFAADPEWGKFTHIETVSGVQNVEATAEQPTGYYNLQGLRSDKPFQGLNIVVGADGKAYKRVF